MQFKTYFESTCDRNYKLINLIGHIAPYTVLVVEVDNMDSMSAVIKKYIDIYVAFGDKKLLRKDPPTNETFHILRDSEYVKTFFVRDDFPSFNELKEVLQDSQTNDYINKHGIESLDDFMQQKQFNNDLSSREDALFDKDFLDGL